jgi:transcriptional regulator GlxA family with amidase domain
MRFLFLIIFGWVISCQDKEKPNDLGPPVDPPKVLNAAFLIVDGVYNSELMAPMDVFHHTVFHTSKGMRVFTIAPSSDTITTFEGLRILPDYSFDQDSIPEIDLLIIPSAQHSMDTDLKNERLMSFVAKAAKQSQYVMSLCDGAFLLAHARLLDTYECTTFPGDINRFKETFPNLTVHERVSFVHDRKFLTSAGGAKSYDVALYLTQLLYGKTVAEGIAKGLVISWDLSTVDHVRVGH